MDPETGAIYHVKYFPPPPEVEDRLITRSDDTEEKCKNRLKVGAYTRPLFRST
jgi:adenylate kinase